jgi:hypothetical protein
LAQRIPSLFFSESPFKPQTFLWIAKKLDYRNFFQGKTPSKIAFPTFSNIYYKFRKAFETLQIRKFKSAINPDPSINNIKMFPNSHSNKNDILKQNLVEKFQAC